MTNETEQLRRMVEARERATKGDWSVCQFEGTGFKNQVMVSPTICTAYGGEGEALANAELIALSGTLDLRSILTRMEKMEAALRFYANAENYFQRMWADECGGISGPSSAMLNDQGQRAREAIENE